MKKRIRIFLCLFAIGAFLALPMHVGAHAPRSELSVQTVADRTYTHHPPVPVSVNGVPLAERGRLIQGTTYIPLRTFVCALGAPTVTYDAQSRSVTVRAQGLELTAGDGNYVIFANGRTLFSHMPTLILSDGKMYAPIRPIAKAFGVSVAWEDATRSVKVTGDVRHLVPAAQYYRADDVYWLSRIISAESAGEPLLGQISVGTVVLNRVRCADFPDTIWGVIFDRKYGVQFTPVANGTIYRAPTERAVLAAKICLEGYVTSDRVLFFMEPTLSTSHWIEKTRTYAFSVAHHDFYS